MPLTWTREQGTGGNVNSFDFPANVKAGTVLIAATAGDNGTTPSAPVDTLTNTWVQLGTVDDTTNGIRITWWYAISNGAGANSITFTNMGAFDAYLIEEWSVSAGTVTLDNKDTGNLRDHTNATDNIVSGSFSTVVADELVIGFNVEDGANVVISAGTGFVKHTETNLEGFTGNPVTLEAMTKASPGSVSALFTGDASGRGAAFVAAFKSSAASGGPTTPGHYRLVGPTQLGATASTVFTAAAKTRIETITVSNPTGGAVTVTLSIGTDAAGTRLLDAFSIPANRVWTQHVYIPIENTEVIQAKAGSAGALVLTLDGTVF